MRTVIIIPARYNSSRFPGKPLARLIGKPMIQHVYERVKESKRIDDVYVATDDERIQECVESFNGKCVMTSNRHQSGSDRLAEAVKTLALNDSDIVLNVQGDEPLIKCEMIEELIDTLKNNDEVMGTLCEKISDESDLNNPNVVKVVFDNMGHALYFSRSLIPYYRNEEDNRQYYRHVGVYAYKVSFLNIFTSMPKGRLERIESLEQLRAIENGYRIRVKETAFSSLGVDTQEQLIEVEKIMLNEETK